MWTPLLLLPPLPLLLASTQPQPPSCALHPLHFHAIEQLPFVGQIVLEFVLERFWIMNEDVYMLSEGTCDSELGSYPGQVMQCLGF